MEDCQGKLSGILDKEGLVWLMVVSEFFLRAVGRDGCLGIVYGSCRRT